MRAYILSCAKEILNVMSDIVERSLVQSLDTIGVNKRFEGIKPSISQFMGELLDDAYTTTLRELNSYIDIQKSFPITSEQKFYTEMNKLVSNVTTTGQGKMPDKYQQSFNNNGFIQTMARSAASTILGNSGAANFVGETVSATIEDLVGSSSDEDEQNEEGEQPGNVEMFSSDQTKLCEAVRKLIQESFSLVCKEVLNFVPKCILYLLVMKTVDKAQQSLVRLLIYYSKDIMILLRTSYY